MSVAKMTTKVVAYDYFFLHLLQYNIFDRWREEHDRFREKHKPLYGY